MVRVAKRFWVQTPMSQPSPYSLFPGQLIRNHGLQYDRANQTCPNRTPSPLSQQEVVRLDVGVHQVHAVKLLHHVQQAGGEVHDQRLGHHLVTQLLVLVDGVLEGAEPHGEGKSKNVWQNGNGVT